MKKSILSIWLLLLSISLLLVYCKGKNQESANAINSIENLRRGDIVLCGPDQRQLGKTDFSFSCSEKARDTFNMGLALLHSFEYSEAEKAFVKVLENDPDCAMAYWGIAMANFHPLWAAPNKEELQKGTRASSIALNLKGSNKREQAYIEAIHAFFNGHEELKHAERAKLYEQAMEKIYLEYPDDKEAAILYTLALDATADPTDKTYTNQKKAGAILNKLYPGRPDHPGVVHYIIHNYDYPELAPLGLEAARKYASVAPSSAHALHMPSHIFTRMGLWDESIQSNLASAAAAKCYAEALGANAHNDQELHAMDYLVYAYLQTGQEQKAKEQIDYLRSMKSMFPEGQTSTYAIAAMPARYVLELRNWKEAASLDTTTTLFDMDKYPWSKAILHFTRVLGAVHTGNIVAAKKDLTSLEKQHARLVKSGDDYKANQVLIQVKMANAWIQFAEGDKENALAGMQAAAELEEKTGKHPATPGEVIPAREILGDMLLAAGKNEAAQEAYKANLKRTPNRKNSLSGASIAANRSGTVALHRP